MALVGITSFDEQQLKRRLAVEIDQKALFKKIDDIFHLTGAGVIYIDSNSTVVELRKFEPVCQISPIKVVLREPPRQMSQQEFASHLKGSQSDIRESKLVDEVSGSVLSCGAAVLGWLVIFGSSAAIPVSGGISLAVSYFATAATMASTLQCFSSLNRVNNEIKAPSRNDALDSQEWYSATIVALDVISLAGATAAGAATLKGLKLLKASSLQNSKVLLKKLSRTERKRLTQDIIRLNHPGVSNLTLKRLINAGGYPKRYTGTQISSAMTLQLIDAVGATMSFAGSALSGTVNSLAIGVYEEVAN